jgi:hypothetical protein
MLVFQTLSAGNMGQFGAPGTVVPVTAGGADADGLALEGAADGAALVREAPAADSPAVEVLCAPLEAAAVRAPAEQPAPAAAIATTATTAPAREARTVTRDIGRITVASWHGPAGRTGDRLKRAGGTTER